MNEFRVVIFDLKKNLLTGYTTSSVPHNGDVVSFGNTTIKVMRVVPMTGRKVTVVELHGKRERFEDEG